MFSLAVSVCVIASLAYSAGAQGDMDKAMADAQVSMDAAMAKADAAMAKADAAVTSAKAKADAAVASAKAAIKACKSAADAPTGTIDNLIITGSECKSGGKTWSMDPTDADKFGDSVSITSSFTGSFNSSSVTESDITTESSSTATTTTSGAQVVVFTLAPLAMMVLM